MDTYGLIGQKLGHSFSKAYFEKKFKDLKINARYLNFELDDICQLKNIIHDHPELKGLNVTIPYKKASLDFIDRLDSEADMIGSVNTLKIERHANELLISGYNTDVIGFEESIKPLLENRRKISALILGTGGASNAVSYVLDKWNIPSIFVSRKHQNNTHIAYDRLTPEIIKTHQLIINSTPLGMYPDLNKTPDIQYQYLDEDHILYDLIYNPAETLFLKKGRERGCKTMNGQLMLELQAEASWKIWTA